MMTYWYLMAHQNHNVINVLSKSGVQENDDLQRLSTLDVHPFEVHWFVTVTAAS